MLARLYHYGTKKREGLILQYGDGVGEIAPLPGFSRETLQEALEEILFLLPHLDQAEPKLPSVQFGLDCARTPFSLAPLRIPLCSLNQPRPGTGTLKLKLGSLPLPDAIALVKRYLGKYRLRLDCNRKWTLEQALAFARHFSPDDFEFLEEPLQSFSDLVRFSEITQFPLAVDESFRDAPFLEVPTLKAVVIKPTLVGKIPKLPPHLTPILSSSYESSIGLLQIGRLATGTTPQGLDTFQEDLLTPPLFADQGHLVWTPSPNPIDWTKLCPIAHAP